MAANDVLFSLKGVIGALSTDIETNDDDTRRRHAEGDIAWLRDGYSQLRLFTYRKNISGSAFAAGDLVSRSREVETNQTGTATTSSTGTWSGADEHIGSVFIVHDDAGGAGGAPEGEATLVRSNTATVVTFEPNLPLSVALAANDDVTLISPKCIDAADGDFNFVVCGISMSAIPDDDWGWIHFQGLHPRAQHKSTDAVTAGNPVVADAAAVGAHGSDVANLWVGYQVATHGGDALQIKSPVVLSLLPVFI